MSTNPRQARSDTPKPLRLHGSIARKLGIKIVSGEFKPGDILDGEIAASEHFRVSRTAYREAIRILAAKGLVHSRPKVGTRVSQQRDWHMLDPDVLAWIFAEEPDPTLIRDLFELRRLVEPEAARLAALRRNEAQVARMRAGIEGMAEYGLASEAGRRADQEFHSALLDASGNIFLSSLTSGVSAAVTWTTAFKQRRLILPRDSLPEHVRVHQAVEAGDAREAHAAMLALIDNALEDTLVARETPAE